MNDTKCEHDAIHQRFRLKPDIYRTGTVFTVVWNILTILTLLSWRCSLFKIVWWPLTILPYSPESVFFILPLKIIRCKLPTAC